MQIKLKRTGAYAVRAMMDVARHQQNGLRQARGIAADQGIPYKSLTLILAHLVGEGLLIATHGPTGGYALARPASEITLLDIIQAAEGGVILGQCGLRDGPCDAGDVPCPIHEVWARAEAALAGQLTSTTLADLVAAAAGKRRARASQ